MNVIEIEAAKRHDEGYEARMWDKEWSELEWEEMKILWGTLLISVIVGLSFYAGIWWWFKVHP